MLVTSCSGISVPETDCLSKALRTLGYLKNAVYPFCLIWRLDSGVCSTPSSRTSHQCAFAVRAERARAQRGEHTAPGRALARFRRASATVAILDTCAGQQSSDTLARYCVHYTVGCKLQGWSC
eukprot:COSAG02_NODE_239_length_27693_cov_31.385700_11_plen_123_part_00